MNTRKCATILIKSICVKGVPGSEIKIFLLNIYKKNYCQKS